MIGGTGGKKAGNKGEREDRLGQTGEEKVFSVEEGGGKAEVTPATFEITAEELDTVPMEQEAAAGAPEAGTSAWEITGAELDAVQPALVFTAEELDAAGHRLEFTPEELDAVLAGKGGPTVEQGEPPLKPAGFKEKLLGLIPTNLWQMAVAGLAGAVLAWVVYECFGLRTSDYRSLMDLVLIEALWGFVISGIIGFSFGAVESLLNRQYGLVLQKGLRWMCGAAAGGFLGSGAGEIIYNLLLQRYVIPPFPWQIFARTLGWALFGAGMGMGNGWMAGDRKRFVNGLIGGIAGGAAGGLVFDFISIPLPYGEGSAARLIGFLALGGGIGALIGLVEHLRREVWFAAVSGPMQGKEFILFGKQTVFGSSGKADIVLYGDPSVPPYAFRVETVDGHSYRVTDLTGQGMVRHNNLPEQQFSLRNGDLIGIGKHLLQIRVKIT